MTKNFETSKEVPKKTEALLDAYKSKDEIKDTKLDVKSIEDNKGLLERLPTPTGYRLLVLPYAGPQKTKGGLYLADTTQETIHRDGSDIRPDMIVNLPNRGCIAIDAKAPLKSYLNASESQNETIQKDELVKHSKSMRTFMRSLYQKEYWSQFENAPELVVMFVPLESALYSAFEHDKELFDDALKHKVLIVSAVSLIALLKSIHHGWMQVQLDENTQKIADAGRNLYERFSKFSLMFQDIGKKLNTTQTAFNKAASSMNARLIPSMKKLKDMGTGSEEIKTSELLDVFEESEDQNQLT